MSSAGYSPLDRALHHMALGPRLVREASFDIDQDFAHPDAAAVRDMPHVFIAGLARSGTTVLMRAFHASGRFRSLTYRDMPFVLMPNLWQRFSARGRKAGEKRERAHADGVMVDYDSPEAFEEVFWSTFAGAAYISAGRLVPHEIDDPTLDKFRRYVAAVLLCTREPVLLYLSKNNNNILRLGSIRRAFPSAIVLMPFRHPLAQSRSLLAQHRKFSKLQAEDRFARRYMAWLGHHEFGLEHRPFVFSADEEEALGRHDPGRIEYWLTLWTHAYRHLLDHAAGARFVSYETLCGRPRAVVESILGAAAPGFDVAAMTGELTPARMAEDGDDIDRGTLAASLDVHRRLAAVAAEQMASPAGIEPATL